MNKRLMFVLETRHVQRRWLNVLWTTEDEEKEKFIKIRKYHCILWKKWYKRMIPFWRKKSSVKISRPFKISNYIYMSQLAKEPTTNLVKQRSRQLSKFVTRIARHWWLIQKIISLPVSKISLQKKCSKEGINVKNPKRRMLLKLKALRKNQMLQKFLGIFYCRL